MMDKDDEIYERFLAHCSSLGISLGTGIRILMEERDEAKKDIIKLRDKIKEIVT